MSFELLAGRDHSAHPELALWHGNIGQSVALDLAPPAAPAIRGLDILSWNLAIGRAYLDELIARLRTEAFGAVGTQPDRPFVMLLQEAYREDPSVPEQVSNRFHGGHVPVLGFGAGATPPNMVLGTTLAATASLVGGAVVMVFFAGQVGVALEEYRRLSQSLPPSVALVILAATLLFLIAFLWYARRRRNP